VKPLRKEQVDLVNVLFERGVTGGVVLHVVGGAQTFTGVEGDLRWSPVGLSARRALALGAAQQGSAVRQGLVVVLERRQQQLG